MVAFYNGVTVFIENGRATDVICLQISKALGIDKLLPGGSTFPLVLDKTERNSGIFIAIRKKYVCMSMKLKDATLPKDLPNT